jgi:hypothetical protein
MLQLFRSIGRAIKRTPLPGSLTNPSAAIRWNAVDIPARVIKMRLEFDQQKG